MTKQVLTHWVEITYTVFSLLMDEIDSLESMESSKTGSVLRDDHNQPKIDKILELGRKSYAIQKMQELWT